MTDKEIKLDAYADDGRFFLKVFSLCIQFWISQKSLERSVH